MSTVSHLKIRDALMDVAQQYPPEYAERALADVPRMTFSISLITQRRGVDTRICDVGGGLGLFSLGCAALGMKACVVDDFQDPVNETRGDSGFALHHKYGVTVVQRDVVEEGLGKLGRFDVVTSFDSMEHWHNSPRTLFHEITAALGKTGLFVLGVPNRANLRKRISLPLGLGKWSSMADWYDVERFRGHVREPDVQDLRYIARDLDLTDIEILGRNWMGAANPNRWVRLASRLADRPLQRLPSLCSDLYLLGRPHSA